MKKKKGFVERSGDQMIGGRLEGYKTCKMKRDTWPGQRESTGNYLGRLCPRFLIGE